MRKLNRKGLDPPATWGTLVKKTLPNDFEAKAREFEENHPLTSKVRKDGFGKFAPGALKVKSGSPWFPDIWKESKEPMRKFSGQKCAYCEEKITASRSGQVEHFRPKTKFPTQAYVWKNYFLACNGCNGAKGNKWPHENGLDYVRPDEETFDPKTFEFHQNGKVKAVGGAAAERTIKDFALNRDWLVDARKDEIEEALEILDEILDSFDWDPDQAKRRVTRLLARRSRVKVQFSEALRQCLIRAWDERMPGMPL